MSFVLRHQNSNLPTDLVRELSVQPDALIERGNLIKPGDRTTIIQLDWLCNDHQRTFCLKRSNRKGAFHTSSHLLLPSRAEWSWQNGLLIQSAGLRTPTPLAAVEERIGPAKLRSFLLTEWIEGQSLIDWIAAHEDDVNSHEFRFIVEQMRNIWQTLGRHRITHDDMKATNFLIDADNLIWLIDLDGMRVPKTKAMFQRGRAKDKQRFFKNWKNQPEVAAAFHAAFDTSTLPGE